MSGMELSTAPRKPRVLLVTSGSVAATKFADLCRRFKEWGEVKAVATKTSLNFIDRESFPRDIDLYTDEDERYAWTKIGDSVLHIDLSRWADVIVISPLSANTLGKIAGGLCDNLVTCIVRAWDFKKLMFIAPSMNILTWKNPMTERNLMSVDELGVSLIPPSHENGEMAEPSHIFSTVRLALETRAKKRKNVQ